MARDLPSSPSRRVSTPALRDVGGISAALELSPLASLLVDASGVLLACNARYAEDTGVPHALLLGREWWQAFAARSASTAQQSHQAIVAGGEERGNLLTALVQADG